MDETAASVDKFVVGVWKTFFSVSGFDDDGFLEVNPEAALRSTAWLIQQRAGLGRAFRMV